MQKNFFVIARNFPVIARNEAIYLHSPKNYAKITKKHEVGYIQKTINFSTDITLIIECCKTTQHEKFIQELILKIDDWDEFIELSYAHGVFPLVYHTLKTHTDIVPSEILKTMKSHNMNIAKQNMLMTAELIKVMKLLEENGIEAMPFKGPVLSDAIYGNIAYRLYADLDILIDKKDIEKCYKILYKNNYTTDYNEAYLKNDLYIDKNSDMQFFHKKNNILIEIHWKLFRNQFSKNLKHIDLFNNKSETILQNHKLYTFSDEMLLLYLCMHGSKHCWERISWILDIDKLLRRNQNLNWSLIQEQAIELESNTMLHLGLELANKYFSSPIPIAFQGNINLVNYVENSFDYLHLDKTEVTRNSTAFKFHYALHDTFLQKIRFIGRTIFPINGQDILGASLPKKLYFLYYVLKPYRLLTKYISKLFK